MNERQLREQICEIGRRVYDKGFAAANDGNISCRLNDREFLCSPTMICKGFMKPDDMCVVDGEGKQLRGTRKRTSEFLLHLSVYKQRPDVQAVVHCHPPHATAFGVAHEPIPKCILPEVEVFLGEVPMAVYETPGGQKFADTISPYVKDCNTIILANHGTVSFGPDLEKAYWNTEIVDAYCRILILARQLGRVHYFNEREEKELLALKKKLGYDDPRFRIENCDLCANNLIGRGTVAFQPEAEVFIPPSPAGNGQAAPSIDDLVKTITDQVMATLG
jgi:L-fuculose-phosphate aldolase